MTEANHSPLPWTTGESDNGRADYIFAHGQAIADCEFVGSGMINEANAALIVRSVNLLPELIQALELARNAIWSGGETASTISALDAVLHKAKQP